MAYELQTLTNNLDASLTAVKEALPKDFNRARFLQNTVAVIKANPDLQKYNSTELLTCCLQASYLGLDFMSKEAWLVPYSGHVQFQMGYKGACKFVKKYSIRPLSDVYAKEVRKGDDFEYGIKDGKPYLDWKPLPFNGGETVGVFAIAQFEDGGMLYEVMSKEEVDKIRRRSRASSNGPWVTDYGEMAKKTVLKKLCKNIETDFDNVEQREAWEADNAEYQSTAPAETVDPFEKTEEVIDTTAVDIEQMEMPFAGV